MDILVSKNMKVSLKKKAPAASSLYLAYSIALVSRITVTLIWPG